MVSHERASPPPTFGQLLAQLRQQRALSQIELARRAGLTPEHLNRLERGHRLRPQRRSVDRLIAALDLSPSESRPLLMAAGFAPRPDETEVDEAARTAVVDLLATAAAGLHRPMAGAPHLPPLSPGVLPSLSPVCTDTTAVIQTALTLLRAAAAAPPPRGHPPPPIGLAIANPLGLVAKLPESDAWALAVIHGLLERGWATQALLREEDFRDVEVVRLARRLLPLFGLTGRFEPFILSRETAPAAPFVDCLTVPTIGALLLFRTHQQEVADGGLLLLDPAACRLVHQQFAVMRAGARPLLASHALTVAGRVQFDALIAAALELPGDDFLVRDGFRACLTPLPVWQAQISRAVDRDPALAGALEPLTVTHQRKREAFFSQIGHERFRHLCAKSALRQEWAWLDGLGKRVPALPAEQLAVLDEVLRVLDDHPGYELALLDREDEALVRTNWEVKGQHTVVLQSWRLNERGQREDLALLITHPAIVTAFRAYADSLWLSLPSRCRDRQAVRRWLEQERCRLAEQVSR
jgi:transcriptional regulator with XRE-family HTH domain